MYMLFHDDYFNPRSPCGERPRTLYDQMLNNHFNPRSPCGERRFAVYGSSVWLFISIHAPRAGSDIAAHRRVWCQWNFNPRSPCGERRSTRLPQRPPDRFQSTLPVRGATHWPYTQQQSPATFQSTLPVRGATFAVDRRNVASRISIHAPRAGSDFGTKHYQFNGTNFNPRSPCGERRNTAFSTLGLK